MANITLGGVAILLILIVVVGGIAWYKYAEYKERHGKE